MVLLVDDNAVQLNARKLILSRAGFDVTTADSPLAALDILDSELSRTDLVVTDHVMPGMGGVEFVQAVRGRTVQVPVLVISGMADAKEEYDGLDISWLSKPCPPEQLIERVTELTRTQLSRTA